MTSPAKIRANRRNARLSTGPTSDLGKRVAARNARHHGLTLPVVHDPALARDVEALARTIETSLTGEEADEIGHDYACRIAESIVDGRRVRAAKKRLIAALDENLDNPRALRRLFSLDRYEDRAFGRRQRAIRAFDALMGLRARLAKTKPTGKTQ